MELEESTRSKVDSACEKIEGYAEAGQIVNLGSAFTAVTLDVIMEYCYDACHNCVEEPDFSPHWKRLMTGLFDGAPFAKHFPGLMSAMQSLPRSVATRLNADLGPFFECKDAIDAQACEIWQAEQDAFAGGKERTEEKARTIFHGIMRSTLQPEEKTIVRLSDEAFVLIVAGAETTARVLTVILSYLFQNAELFTRLREELDKVVNPSLPPSKELEKIPLMKAVVQERSANGSSGNQPADPHCSQRGSELSRLCHTPRCKSTNSSTTSNANITYIVIADPYLHDVLRRIVRSRGVSKPRIIQPRSMARGRDQRQTPRSLPRNLFEG